MKSINLKPLKLSLLASLLACGFLPALASATPVKFDINGHYARTDFFPVAGDFTGTMDVDTATGKLLSFEALFPELATFNDVWDSRGSKKPPQWTVGASNAWGDYLSLTFATPQVDGHRKRGSLVDFDGGFITGDGVIGFLFGPPCRASFSGDITPAQVSVPEPAALGMFGAGVLLLGLFVGLRCRYD